MMKNYYFISSPLHFFIASNLAIENYAQCNVAVILSKSLELAKSLMQAIDEVDGIFDESVSLANYNRLGKLKHRRVVMKDIQAIFSKNEERRIYTGNDRRIEFQYAMHIASQSGGAASGVYMDDGAVSYIGHKSMHSFAHRYLDPLLKKIIYGSWWKSALTTGTSSWISIACLAFPEHAHVLLKGKTLKKINSKLFSSEKFKQLSATLLHESGVDLSELATFDVLITLPHEDAYKDQPELLKRLYQGLLQQHYGSNIAVKAHPRSQDLELLAELFPESVCIEKSLGFELILPLLKDEVIIVGDISTTLLSAKWLRPAIKVEYFGEGGENVQMSKLFKLLGINRRSLDI